MRTADGEVERPVREALEDKVVRRDHGGGGPHPNAEGHLTQRLLTAVHDGRRSEFRQLEGFIRHHDALQSTEAVSDRGRRNRSNSSGFEQIPRGSLTMGLFSVPRLASHTATPHRRLRAKSAVSSAHNEKPAGLITTIADGKGADCSDRPNRRRPGKNRISWRMAYWCHHRVSVRAGTRHTVVARSWTDASCARFIHWAIAAPYGGFMNTTSSAHSCLSPSSCLVKCLAHFAFKSVEQGSNVNRNSWFR